ncbi:MAG: TetR/AcrR family transcriptional regulator, partial [Micromonosporaceae bacterium]
MSPVRRDVKAGRGAPRQPDARRDRWSAHRETRRRELIEAAMRALAEHGPDVRIEHIAAEAGVTKPVLYRHFADKAELFVAIGQRGTELLFERLLPALQGDAAPLAQIRNSLDAFFSVIEEHPNVYRLLARRHIADRPVDPDIVAEDKEVIATAIARLLGDYLRLLNLDSGAAEPWAYGLVGMVQNTAEWWLERQSMSRESVVDYLTQLVWAAIDGFTRQHGVVLDPHQPLGSTNVVRLAGVSPDPAAESRDETQAAKPPREAASAAPAHPLGPRADKPARPRNPRRRPPSKG